jgi:HEAT repeat protein
MESDGVDRIETGALFAQAVQLATVDTTRDSDEYWRTIRILHKRAERDVFEQAVACCAGVTPVERQVGADVLAQIGTADTHGVRPFTEESVPVLRALLADANDDVIASAIHALAHHHHENVGDFSRLARHESQAVRYAIAHALSGHHRADAIAILIELTTDVDDSIRDWATFAIGTQCDVDGPEIREALGRRLVDADEEVRGEAMVGLARRRAVGVVDYVAEALTGSNPSQLVFDAAKEILAAWPDEARIKTALEKWQTE